ncbi:hypothetical protein MA12_gp34 [Pectobacterium phage MA12]|uniref:DUF7443 domain-containing protein n=1 Tax=Pectobacterium phage MA12 TaxID=2686474 RepID=A0A6B9RJZ6_9CAUD|nr:hypothetical protein JT356_gp18 [Pectobacterium phage MA11]YP_010000256.1 hypothetical protein JT357_gp34 [Pectobacterium phage MA12]QGF21042.1 hypothetical protein MA11_gp18 [Pectobacterium phage MA11]QHI00861.1 hypothetical protein MA12_gp34 [Pectobacterium phage MA12]
MPKRIAVHTLVLTREGKRVTVKPGDLVDLTSDEVKELNALNAIRQPVNESPAETPAEEQVADKPKGDETPPAAGKKAGGKGKEEEL